MMQPQILNDHPSKEQRLQHLLDTLERYGVNNGCVYGVIEDRLGINHNSFNSNMMTTPSGYAICALIVSRHFNVPIDELLNIEKEEKLNA